ncbi:helix-turn-helix domain-containing protein [Streptomyces sp. ISL-100]|uniref:helix-turn-helix domain-containing protein n=1 Tax=Streptomyces sp. ISL-100 TaxID=2819173 RepID=UPI0035ABADE1
MRAPPYEDSRPLPPLRAHLGETTTYALGMTFPQWRTQLRLYHALRMLAVDTPVTTVAHHCGWSATRAFIDVFRRAFGDTPGAYSRSRMGVSS